MIWAAAALASLVLVAYYGVLAVADEFPTAPRLKCLATDALLRAVLGVGVAGLLLAVLGMAGVRANPNPLPIALIVAGASVCCLKQFAYLERGRVEVDTEDRYGLAWLAGLVCVLSLNQLLFA